MRDVCSLFLVQEKTINEMVRAFIAVDKFFIMNCFLVIEERMINNC